MAEFDKSLASAVDTVDSKVKPRDICVYSSSYFHLSLGHTIFSYASCRIDATTNRPIWSPDSRYFSQGE